MPWPLALLVAVLAAALVSARLRLRLVTVRGYSMAPTYRDGDLLLVLRGRRLRRGRAVVFHCPDHGDPPLLVKRVVALPGDRHPAFGWPVPPATFAVLGDNLDRSRDSRHFGPLATAAAVGHVLHHFPRRHALDAPPEGRPTRRSGADAGLSTFAAGS